MTLFVGSAVPFSWTRNAVCARHTTRPILRMRFHESGGALHVHASTRVAGVLKAAYRAVALQACLPNLNARVGQENEAAGEYEQPATGTPCGKASIS